MEVIRTEPRVLSHEFSRNYKEKIDKYFPGNLGLIDGWRLVGFRLSMRIFKEVRE
jgi:hypothetical protein